MKIAALMIAAVIVLLLLPASVTAIDDFRLVDYVNAFDTTTAAADTDSTMALSQELYGDETRNATVTSNVTADAPIASSYVSGNQTLTVTGLEASTNHRLTVTYKIDRLSDYTGAGVAARVMPVLIVLGALGIIVGAVYQATRGRGE